MTDTGYVQPQADFRLTVDGEEVGGTGSPVVAQDITDAVRPRLISLTLTEKRGGEADQLDLVLEDNDGKLAIPRKRALIRLSLGWLRGAGSVPVGLIDKGRFTVDEVEWGGPPDQVTIRARSADLTAAFGIRRERSFRASTLGAIIREVAMANGLTARCAPALAAIAVPIVDQHARSDMALLSGLGRKHDAVATVKDRTLIFAPIGTGTTAGGRALPSFTLTRDQVSDFRYREIDRSAEGGVEARWHDTGSAERKTVKVGGGTGKPRRLRKVFASEADARTHAAAAANRNSRAAFEFEVTLPLGRADLSPEQRGRVSGFKAQPDGQAWLIAELTHTLDGQGGLGTKVKFEAG